MNRLSRKAKLAAMLILFSLGSALAAYNAILVFGNPGQNIPPPPISNSNEQKTKTSISSGPPPPPPPTRNDALRELSHAYDEYNHTMELMQYAIGKGLNISAAQGLVSVARALYLEALNYYNTSYYVECLAYTHAAIEALHGARDIVVRILASNGYPPPPP